MKAELAELFPGDTQMAALMRARDWSTTPLGSVDTWPQSLKTIVRVLLTSRFAMWMGYGPSLTFFYNDAYAAMTAQNPYTDDASQKISFWANKYKTKFNEDPTVFSAYGYTIIDAFQRAASKAGQNLTTDSFIKAMDTMVIPQDMFGSAEATYGPKKRLGSDSTRLSQIVDGKWKVISDYVKMP